MTDVYVHLVAVCVCDPAGHMTMWYLLRHVTVMQHRIM